MITDREVTPPAGEERDIWPGALVRCAGLLAMASGASIFVTPLLHPEDPRSAAWVPVHLLYFTTLIGVLLVLVGSSPASYRGPVASAWPVYSSRSSARR